MLKFRKVSDFAFVCVKPDKHGLNLPHRAAALVGFLIEFPVEVLSDVHIPDYLRDPWSLTAKITSLVT